jgi:hypothetical protein
VVYCSTYVTEGILFHNSDDANDFDIIALTKDVNGETFTVDVDFDENWEWKFVFSPANYEMIKHMIMSAASTCDNEDELLMELENLFEDMFKDIVVWNVDYEECTNEECNCENGCKHCGCI